MEDVAWWSLLALLSWYHVNGVKSVQLIRKLCTRRFHLSVPHHQINCNEFTFEMWWQGSSPHNGHQSDMPLIHWGRVTHICISKLTILGSDNGLSLFSQQAIIWTNDGILLIKPLGTTFSEILIEIHTFSFKKMHLKMLSVKWRPSCLGLNISKAFYQ